MAEWSFLVDESVSNKIAQHLRSLGFEAEFVKDVLDEGAGDFEDIVPYARDPSTGGVAFEALPAVRAEPSHGRHLPESREGHFRPSRGIASPQNSQTGGYSGGSVGISYVSPLTGTTSRP